MLSQSGVTGGSGSVDAEIERILAEVDKDGDGEVDYEVRWRGGREGRWTAGAAGRLGEAAIRGRGAW